MDAQLDREVVGVRQFNRFYTKQIGALNEGLLGSDFTLTEARVIYELANRQGPSATELGRILGLDAGYLSRTLAKLESRGLVAKAPSPTDARQSRLSLKDEGRRAFAALDARAHDEIRALLKPLAGDEQRRLLASMQTIERLLAPHDAIATKERVPYLLRTHQPGDMGWVVHRHGVLYAREYGWDERFEGLVAAITAEFIEKFDARRERCWIAERDGEIVGSVFLVNKSETDAKLRLLLVEPSARGLGIGKRLVSECTRFARQAGYRRITLWTNSVLTGARRLYEAEGYRLMGEEPHHSFGHDLVGQTWDLDL